MSGVDAANLYAFELPDAGLPTIIRALERESAPLLREAAASATAYLCAVLMAAAEEGEGEQDVLDWILGPLTTPIPGPHPVALHESADRVLRHIHRRLTGQVHRPPIPQIIDTTFTVSVPAEAGDLDEHRIVLVAASCPTYLALWHATSHATPWPHSDEPDHRWGHLVSLADPARGVLSWSRDLSPLEEGNLLSRGRDTIDLASRVVTLVDSAPEGFGMLTGLSESDAVALLTRAL